MDLLNICDNLILLVSGIGCIVFIYWWIKVKRSTLVYKYITILLFTIFFEKFAEYFQMNFIWRFKNILLLIIISIFIGHMIIRLINSSVKLKKIRKEIYEHVPEDDDQFIIAVVEDDIQVQTVICEYILKNCPKTTPLPMTIASEVFNYIESNKKLAMVICDMKIDGDMSGIKLCEELKQIRPWIVFIGMTGYPNEYNIFNARRSGFDDYFIKPFRLSDLSRSIVYHKKLLERWNKIIDRY